MEKEGTVVCLVSNREDAIRVYSGRLICVMDDEQFNSLVTNPEMATKLYTMESIPISHLADNAVSAKGKRLVVAVNKKSNVDFTHRKLFVSEKIVYFDLRFPKTAGIRISCSSGWVSIKRRFAQL